MSALHLRLQPAGDAIDAAGAEEAVDALARTLWGEARTRSVRALEAVAAVALNRAAALGTADVASVCRDPDRFPCWAEDNRAALLTADPADLVFALCRRIARRALGGGLADPTSGATRHHPETDAPAWAAGLAPTAVIGGMAFYRGA